jgi:hypothetical protein
VRDVDRRVNGCFKYEAVPRRLDGAMETFLEDLTGRQFG